MEYQKGMKGVLFRCIARKEGRLFLVAKTRVDVNQQENLALYYVLDGIVYQAPVLHDVIDSRIQNSMNELEKVLVEMQACLRFGVDGAHFWQFPGDEDRRRKQREWQEDEFSIRERGYYGNEVQGHVGQLVQQMEHETMMQIHEKMDHDE